MTINKTLGFYKIVCAFGLFAGQPLKAVDTGESCNRADLEGALRVLQTAARNLKVSDDEKLRALGDKIAAEISGIEF